MQARASFPNRPAAAASNVGALVFSAARGTKGNKMSAVVKILMLTNVIGASRLAIACSGESSRLAARKRAFFRIAEQIGTIALPARPNEF